MVQRYPQENVRQLLYFNVYRGYIILTHLYYIIIINLSYTTLLLYLLINIILYYITINLSYTTLFINFIY
jgi:pilus assembly protein TadC